jgi:hypothetical protein
MIVETSILFNRIFTHLLINYENTKNINISSSELILIFLITFAQIKQYMKTKIKITTTFNCTLERAFRSPMLCDVTKVHTGYGMMPRVTHCKEDENWGKIGSSKKVFVEKSMIHKGGFGSVDNVVERIENKYWKIEINQFQAWMLSFNKFVGEWQTTEIEKGKILIEYTYTLYSNNVLLYPINWIFTKTFWKKYMKHALENVKQLTIDKEPYLYP